MYREALKIASGSVHRHITGNRKPSFCVGECPGYKLDRGVGVRTGANYEMLLAKAANIRPRARISYVFPGAALSPEGSAALFHIHIGGARPDANRTREVAARGARRNGKRAG